LFAVANSTLALPSQLANGVELWESDDTAADTVLVTNISPGGGLNPASLTNADGILFFTAADGVHGSELWEAT
jgi:ELWxxDGT repeat protein